MEPASAASALLLAMGFLGATDIALFHKRAHRLHARPEAVPELVTHALRGPTYAALFLAVPNLDARGAWAVLLLGVLAFDLAISIADFWLEPATRRPQGGLPRGEYLLHIGLAMLFG
ncbi:MAG TPA: SRPBCC family protein, partial [Planctomycetota bacterium]|nr:SRPBCC family protein [Planctomycetota bacterium]